MKRYNCKYKKEFTELLNEIKSAIKKDKISNKELAKLLSKVTETLVDYKTQGCKKDKLKERSGKKPKSKSRKHSKPKSRKHSKPKSRKHSKPKSRKHSKPKSKRK